MSSHYYVAPFHIVLYICPIIYPSCHSSHPRHPIICPIIISTSHRCPVRNIGCKTFTGMKISFWTGQCVYQYSSSCSVEEEVDMPVDFPILMHFPAGHGHNHISSVHYATYVLKILYNYPTLILKECLLVLVLFSFL